MPFADDIGSTPNILHPRTYTWECVIQETGILHQNRKHCTAMCGAFFVADLRKGKTFAVAREGCGKRFLGFIAIFKNSAWQNGLSAPFNSTLLHQKAESL